MYVDDTVQLLGKSRGDQLEVDIFVALNMAVRYCYNDDVVVNENKNQIANRAYTGRKL